MAISSCGPTEIKTVPVNIHAQHPDWFICEKADAASRPALNREYVIDWSHVTTVAQAKAEHDAYVTSIRTREGTMVGYAVKLEGQLFTCWNNMHTQIDYYDGL